MRERTPLKDFNVFIDGTGAGIAHDDPEVTYITPADCATQAIWYSKNQFDGTRIPAYLYRHMHYMCIDNNEGGYGYKYKTDLDVVAAFNSSEITLESQDYIYIKNLITYCESNPESQQVIGLIQLIGGTLSAVKKAKTGIALYILHPETHLHPKKQARFITMFETIREDYGLKQSKIESDEEE